MRTSVRAAAALALAAAAGCGSPAVVVTGRVVRDGEPFRAPGGESVVVYALGGAGPGRPGYQFYAPAEADGSFRLKGLDDKGVPPGPYKLVVSCESPAGLPEPDTASGRLNARYGSASVTPLRYDVTDEPRQRVVIDLTAGTVTRE